MDVAHVVVIKLVNSILILNKIKTFYEHDLRALCYQFNCLLHRYDLVSQSQTSTKPGDFKCRLYKTISQNESVDNN